MEIGLLLTDSLSLFEALIGKGGLTPATVFVVEGCLGARWAATGGGYCIGSLENNEIWLATGYSSASIHLMMVSCLMSIWK